MAAPKTVITFDLDGSNKDFEVPFEYLARKFVVVTLIGTDRRVLTLSTDYRFTQRTIITTTQSWGPADGYEKIEIRRLTSATERLVDFSDGSVLRAYDLNISNVQSLHIAEEGRDIATDTIGVDNNGNLDARGRRIVNLADAVNPRDAVTLNQVQEWSASALNQANRSKAEADRSEAQANIATQQATQAGSSAAGALASKNAASTSETNSKTSETNSKTSETNSKTSETASANSATQAAASAVTATNEANRAKTEADKLANINTFAATIESVSSGATVFSGAQTVTNTQAVRGNGVLTVRFANTDGSNAVELTRGAGGLFRLVDPSTGLNRWSADSAGNFVARGGVVSENGSIIPRATGTSANASLILQGNTGAERAMVWAGDDGILRLRGAAATDYLVVTPAGALGLTSATISKEGNIVSSIYLGGALLTYLQRLEAAVKTPRDTKVALWTSNVPTVPAWAVGGTIVLNDDVRNYVAFSSHWDASLTGTVCTLTGLRELATYPFGTVIYMGAVAGTYYTVRFNDLGDGTYRSLTMTSAGTGATALPIIYGYRRAV